MSYCSPQLFLYVLLFFSTIYIRKFFYMLKNENDENIVVIDL